MKSYSLLRLYVWLVDTILQHGPITLEDINKQWIRTKLSDGIEMNRHTFIRYKNAIEETFGVVIECDRKTNRYAICNPHILHDNETTRNKVLTPFLIAQIIITIIKKQGKVILVVVVLE